MREKTAAVMSELGWLRKSKGHSTSFYRKCTLHIMIFEDMQVKIGFINTMCGQSLELCFLFEYNVSDQEFLEINRPTWVLVG